MVKFRNISDELFQTDNTDWDNGEYIDNDIKKKRLILMKEEKEIDLLTTINEVKKLFKEYKEDRFGDLDKTLLPLARYATSHPVELVGFIVGFLAGSKFEKEGIKIKTEQLEPTDEDKKYYNDMKLGSYDFGVEPHERQ